MRSAMVGAFLGDLGPRKLAGPVSYSVLSVADGKVVASGRRMATAEGRLFDADGKLYSHGTTTCMLLDL